MSITTTLLSLLGFVLFIFGFILILAGVGIISIKQYVEVTRGAKSLIAGIVIALLGALFLFPDARAGLLSSFTATPIAGISTPLTPQTLPTAQPNPSVLASELSSEVPNVPPTICAPDIVRNHETSNPLFIRPEGYGSGWITSDPSDIVLPDGTVRTVLERYVLVVEDLTEVQIRNVALGPVHSKTWGCWFRADLTEQVLPGAERELEKMRQEAPSVTAAMYRINAEGLEKIDK